MKTLAFFKKYLEQLLYLYGLNMMVQILNNEQ